MAKKRLVVMVETDTYERLKQEAADRRTSLGACVREALAQYKKPSPAEPSHGDIPKSRHKLPPELERIRGSLAGTRALESLLEDRRNDLEKEEKAIRS